MSSQPPTALKNSRWLLISIPIFLLITVGVYLIWKPPNTKIPPRSSGHPAPSKSTNLAPLALSPDWSKLDRFQNIISKETFLNRLEKIYTKDSTWKKWITIDDANNKAFFGNYQLVFSPQDKLPPGSLFEWKTRADLSDDRARPLEDLVIAIDPGHIGGDFAKIEEREHNHDDLTIREGTMTLETALILKPLLEKLGASAILVRSKLEPITKNQAQDFADPRLFYRTSEIRARANVINQTIKPDLVICLHFNGTGSKKLIPDQHFHIIINGTYTKGELAHEDERFEMLQRLLSGTITEEIPLAREVAASFNQRTKLPAYRYPNSSRASQNLANHPNLWARNLLANRLYQCPVIFIEPYVMNSIPFVSRYRKNREGIFKEYAQAVADGVARHYSFK